MSRNQEFKSRYNLLDHYVKDLANIKSGSGIFLLKKVVDYKTAAELDTIRGFKNTIVSHNKINVPEPIAPIQYIEIINNIIKTIRKDESKWQQKLKEAAQKYDRSKNTNDNTHKPTKYWLTDEYAKSSSGSYENHSNKHSNDPYEDYSSEDIINAIIRYLNKLTNFDLNYMQMENEFRYKVTAFNRNKQIPKIAEEMYRTMSNEAIFNLIGRV